MAQVAAREGEAGALTLSPGMCPEKNLSPRFRTHRVFKQLGPKRPDVRVGSIASL
jgi:hypothetical protein